MESNHSIKLLISLLQSLKFAFEKELPATYAGHMRWCGHTLQNTWQALSIILKGRKYEWFSIFSRYLKCSPSHPIQWAIRVLSIILDPCWSSHFFKKVVCTCSYLNRLFLVYITSFTWYLSFGSYASIIYSIGLHINPSPLVVGLHNNDHVNTWEMWWQVSNIYI